MGIRKPKSAFRALTDIQQPVVAFDIDQIQYNLEQFDLNDEYDQNTWTFIPNQDGVYSVIASYDFVPANEVDYVQGILIAVNGSFVAGNTSFKGANGGFLDHIVEVSAILNLQAGDEVTAFLQVTTDGSTFNTPNSFGTSFQAARFPSPINGIPNNPITLNKQINNLSNQPLLGVSKKTN